MTSPPPPTLDRIKQLLRRDLKLGPTTDIPDDMPLVGGPLDLDSLDALMVVTSIEKEFGIKSLAEAGGRDVFASVTALAAFVDRHKVTPTELGTTGADAPELDAALAALPHTSPFRFITKVTALVPGVSAKGIWDLDGTEAFFAGHFPGQPIVPGVLIAEALAQLSGILLGTPAAIHVGNCNPSAPRPVGKLGRVDVRFLRPITPPARIELQTTLTRQIGDAAVFDVRAGLNGVPAAEGSLWLSVPSARPAQGPADVS